MPLNWTMNIVFVILSSFIAHDVGKFFHKIEEIVTLGLLKMNGIFPLQKLPQRDFQISPGQFGW